MSDQQKITLITGANKGIGFEVARQLSQSGHTVLLGARNPELGQKAAEALLDGKADVRFVALDVTNAESVVAAAETIRRDFGRLDLLINNAGINVPGDGVPSEISIDVIEKTMATNFFGAVRVTQAMLPLLHAAAEAADRGAVQVINVSSELGSISGHADPDWKYAFVKSLGYCSSKAAMNMFTVQLAYELREKGIAVNAVNPGYTATDLNAHSGPQTIEEGAAEIVRVARLESPESAKFLETGGEIPW